MAVINIPRGPWNIDTVTITTSFRIANGNVIVVTNTGQNYELTVAEAVLLSLTVGQIPPLSPNASAGSIVPSTNILDLGINSATGKRLILAWGVAVNDAGIVAQVGADALYTDGSVYLSVLAGAGTFWLKKNDVWTNAV